MVRRGASIAIGVGTGIIAVALGLMAYSYSQIHFTLDSVGFAGIDWAPLSGSTLLSVGINAFIGDYLGAALALINGIKLDMTFAATNSGFLPVYIPDLSYDLSVNGISVGKGQSHVDLLINPGETRQLPVLQVIQKSSFEPAAFSIVQSEGIMSIKVSGTANFQIFGLTIPVPFQSIKEISIIDEVKKRIFENQPQSVSGGSGIASSMMQQFTSTSLTIRSSSYSVSQGTIVTITGKLITTEGDPVQGAVITLRDNDLGSGDDLIATVYTDANGDYSYRWSARPMDPFDSVTEIYAVYEGGSYLGSSRSNHINVTVS